MSTHFSFFRRAEEFPGSSEASLVPSAPLLLVLRYLTGKWSGIIPTPRIIEHGRVLFATLPLDHIHGSFTLQRRRSLRVNPPHVLLSRRNVIRPSAAAREEVAGFWVDDRSTLGCPPFLIGAPVECVTVTHHALHRSVTKWPLTLYSKYKYHFYANLDRILISYHLDTRI